MSNAYSFYKIFEKSCARHYDETAIIYYKNGLYCEYLYSEAFGVCEYLFQQLQILGFSCGHVGLYMTHNPLISSLIAAIHKNGSAFMFLDPRLPVSDTQNIVRQMNFQIIVSIDVAVGDDVPNNLAGFHLEKLINLYGFYIAFYKTGKIECTFKSDFSYTIRTSGSTGDPKIIHVPHECLKPNIEDLQKIFQSGISDIIMFSTPLTFDPSIIEIYLAATSGSSLLIAPEDASVMFPSGENAKYSVTIWQTTPSKLLQHSDFNISHFILGETSSLRILALGGEPLSNVERLKMLKHDNNKTQLHCLYGVTEMSCWACATQVKLWKNTMEEKEEIPIGECLSGTHIKICKDDEESTVGRILLGSGIRKCVRADDCHSQATKDGIVWVETGDLGELKNNLIYYRGRIDDTVKRFGNKINLHHIEIIASQFHNIKNVCAVWLSNLHFVILYFVSDTVTTNHLKLYFTSRLDNLHQPDRIFKVKNLPLNTHGKIAKQLLMETTLKQLLKGKSKYTLLEMFIAELQDVVSGSLTYESIKNKSFFAIGGNSITALIISNRLKHLYKDSIPTFLPHLLDNGCTIKVVVGILKQNLSKDNQLALKKSSTKRKMVSLKSSKLLKKDVSLQIDNTNKTSFIINWSINMEKCVDAIPTIFPYDTGVLVCIGSHSGKIVITNEYGIIKCSLDINSRIEAPILCFNSQELGQAGVVGTHNGTVCCFTLNNCEIRWTINISCMVKSQAIFIKEHIYIASYDGNIRILKGKDGSIVKIIKISTCGISSDLEITTDDKYIAIAALDGICACVNTSNHIIKWQIKVGSPVFAKPVIFNQNNFILFAEVNGVVHCIKLQTGETLWTYSQVNGHLFTSFLVDDENNVGWKIVFGCHDEHVHCLRWSVKDSPSLLWKKKLAGSIYSTPCKMYEDCVVLVSNRGQLCILDINSGNIEYQYQFPNEVFSSPKVYGEHIFIGCRDDNLYCLTHSKVNKNV